MTFWIVVAVVIVILGVVAYGAYIARSSPGQESTIDEDDHPNPAPPTTPMERFRLAWDSEARADWPVVEPLALMSEQAYLDPVDAEPAYRKLGFDRFTAIVKGTMIGYLVSDEDVVVIAFRGTVADEISDWLANLDCLSVDTPQGAIHQGFFNAYNSMKDQIMKVLGGRRPKYLWITGHSLGGALAVVCAYDLVENEKIALDGVITFGQPMVAHKQLAIYLDKLLLGHFAHFVNEADIVPRIPPSPFVHFGSLVWFRGDKIKRSKPKRFLARVAAAAQASSRDTEEIAPLTPEEFQKTQAELRSKVAEVKRLRAGRAMAAVKLPFIEDHSMNRYVEKIRKLLGISEPK